MEIGGTAKINPRRVEEGITDAISNNVEYPNFNYQVIKGDSVTIDTSVNRHAVVTAVKEGVTVVQVTYNAFDHSAGKHFDAVDPVNTAYVVYSVGGNKDIAITDNIVQKDDDKKNGDDVVFRSYDTLYYTSGETVPFTLKASAEGAENLVVKCNGITVQASASGTWVLPLENRSNIVELKATAADGTVRTKYHVLDARKIKINVENKTNPGEVLHAGDTATVSFTGITMPVYKLATIYNPCMNAWGAKSTNVHYVCNGITYTGSCTQWDLATKNSFDVELTSAEIYTFTNGSIYCEWWGSSLGYDKTTDDPGAPNLSAPINKGEFSFMPDFSIEAESGIEVESVTLDKNELILEYGETEQLTATVSPEGAQKVNWKSDNEDVAKVNDSGLVTAVSAGTTVITAEAGDKTAQCRVTVEEAEPLELTASLTPEKVYDGDAVTLTIEGLEKPEEVTNGGTLWSEKINYSTDIPAMNSISGSGRETITFRVPENTPSGTYYLTNGNYYANFGGTKVQDVFLVGNTEKTFYEGQMPVITLQVVCRAELRAEEQQSATPTPVPVTAKTQLLLLKVTAGKTTAKLTWNKISGADGYQIYGAKCGNSYKLLKTVKNTTLTWKQSKLKKGVFYKYYVVAYKKVNGKNVKISKSENMHVVTIGGKYGNAKKVTVNKSSVSVKKVKTYQLEAKVTNTSKYAKYHARSVRFVTDNPSVAKVSKSGKIKGISKGTCYIYCFANNGIYKKVRITVK